jgi:hypothetical protein
MKLCLQFGHGMMAHSRELLTEWGNGTVILSPRDLTEDQLERVAADVFAANGEPLIDPQCFARDADHARLVGHDYWKVFRSHDTDAFLGGPGTASLLAELAKLARTLGVKKHILPGLVAPSVAEDWFVFQERILGEAPRHFGKEKLISTIALSGEALRDEAQVEAIVERARKWPVWGFYVVAENPGSYLVEDPVWLANLLILVSGLKMAEKHVIVGYCSHQMLCLATAGADAIASGTWLNVRTFASDKFYSPEEGEVSRRATWYYCPQALSEYTLPFLDIALRMGVLDQMAPSARLGSRYAEALFAGATPTSVSWGEQNAFRHYLTCLRSQALAARRPTFAETLTRYRSSLLAAEKILKTLHSKGVFGRDRDFARIVDVNRGALVVFERARGVRLSRHW